MRHRGDGFIAAAAICVTLTACAAYGWLANLLYVMRNVPPEWAGATPGYVLSVVGIFVPPLGAVLGWLL
jgi:hypothetical protein